MVIPSFTDSLNVFLKSFTMIAQKHGYNVTLFMTRIDPDKELEALESCAKNKSMRSFS